MENQEKLDITTLPGYEDVRNLVYKLLGEQLMQPPLLQQVGYDLGNCVWNMSYHQLPEKLRGQFDAYVFRLMSNKLKLSVITSDLLQSEEELSVYRHKFQLLRYHFDKATHKPDFMPNVTEVQVSDPDNVHYTQQFTVTKLYYSEELLGWFVEAERITDTRIKAIFKHTQLQAI